MVRAGIKMIKSMADNEKKFSSEAYPASNMLNEPGKNQSISPHERRYTKEKNNPAAELNIDVNSFFINAPILSIG